jgi:enamine deaminase RidA (YjgF/YER057c/UK114 family)
MAKIQRVTRPAMKALLEPYGLSEAVRYGDTLTLAGQTGMNAEHKIVDGGLKAQATQAFRNIKEVIEFAGGSVDNIVHLTWYLAPSAKSFMEDAIEVTMARNDVLPGIAPGSTAVRVHALLTPEILIEIQTVVAL